MLNDESDKSCFLRFRCFLFLSRRLLFDFLYLLSSDESDLLDDESGELRSHSRSSDTYYFCIFSLRLENSVGSVSVLGSDVLAPNSKISFIVIVVVILCLAHSNPCSFTKNIIRKNPIGTIHRPSYFGSRGTDTTAFIQCVNGQEPQINKFWCLGLDRIFREVHPTAPVDILDGTVREFVTDYLAENGRPIVIIGELSANSSVKFWLLFDQAWGSGLPYIANLLAEVEATGWGSSN